MKKIRILRIRRNLIIWSSRSISNKFQKQNRQKQKKTKLTKLVSSFKMFRIKLSPCLLWILRSTPNKSLWLNRRLTWNPCLLGIKNPTPNQRHRVSIRLTQSPCQMLNLNNLMLRRSHKLKMSKCHQNWQKNSKFNLNI